MARALSLVVIVVLIAGCAHRVCPKPPCAGAPEARTAPVAGTRAFAAIQRLVEARAQRAEARGADEPRIRVLTLSGGGLYGAYGLGVLMGWRDNPVGPKPRFDMVVGISTGALQAPLVFLDTREADAVLRDNYLTAGSADLFCERSLLSLPTADSLYESSRVGERLARVLTNERIDQIAQAATGPDGPRVLLVGTASLDTGKQHLWDITAMAKRARSNPELYDRIRTVVLTSASHPIFMSPVMIDGELHTDGGAREQIMVPAILQTVSAQLRSEAQARAEKAHVASADRSSFAATFVASNYPEVTAIVNGSIGLEWECVQPNLLDLTARTFALLADEGIVGNLWRIWGTVQQDVGSLCPDCFRFLTMPHDVLGRPSSSLDLSRADMRRLFDRGYAVGKALGQTEQWMRNPAELAPRVPRP